MTKVKKVIGIQPKERRDGVLPYPYFIDSKGMVGRQDFWKGEPLKLIGFSPVKTQTFHEKQLTTEMFFRDIQKAIGMYPIFEHKDGEWYTYQEKIASVSFR